MRPLVAVLVLGALALPAAADPSKKTPLDDYVARADPTYAWKLVKTIPGDGVTSFVLDLKSQSWRLRPRGRSAGLAALADDHPAGQGDGRHRLADHRRRPQRR